MTFDLPPKHRRFLVALLHQKISWMEKERDKIGEDDKWQIDNDLPLYEAMLHEAERTK